LGSFDSRWRLISVSSHEKIERNNDNKKSKTPTTMMMIDDDKARLFIHSTLTLTPLPAIDYEDDVMRDGAATCLFVC
jgi:hypothetical protein